MFVKSVGGGYDNTAIGSFSFVAGRRAKALHDGCFVWADSQDVKYRRFPTQRGKCLMKNGDVPQGDTLAFYNNLFSYKGLENH